MASARIRIGMRVAPAVALLAGVAVQAARPSPGQQAPQARFRAATELVSVDVVVRDRAGNVVRGLTAADFEIREDGRAQQILTLGFEEIVDGPVPRPDDVPAVLAEPDGSDPSPGPPPEGSDPSGAFAGRRLMLLLFDVSSMQPEEVQRAVDSAREYVEEAMSSADLVAVATVGSALDVLVDFTGDRAAVAAALDGLSVVEGTAVEAAAASTAATDEAAATATETTSADAGSSELDLFNNDLRLRTLKTLAETLAPIDQKKAIVYFTAGMQRSGQDNQVELRAAINAAVRANVSIYAIDTRGLQAVAPGGDARQASGRGVALFSGRGVAQQFARLSASQDTLVALAEDTGGRAFTDTNDFGDAFARVRRDTSAYYLLGYTSTNPGKDGRFRRIQVRVKGSGLRVEARAGYYADRDFAHTSRSDRETQLQEQLFAPVSATDLPVLVAGGWFRLAADRYYVPVDVAVPGGAIPIASGQSAATLDVLGMVRDERGSPVGRFRQTLDLPSGAGGRVADRQVLYQSGVTLPPGRFSVKVVVRENTTGTMGSFEAPVTVPELDRMPVKVSSVVLSTQLQAASSGRREDPLVRDGVRLLPNLTHVVDRDRRLYFYYEVYDAAESRGAGPLLRTNLAFYRNRVKVYETPVVERTAVDAPDRRAALFQFEVPADAFAPGLYTGQVNIIDSVAGRFAFPRVVFLVR